MSTSPRAWIADPSEAETVGRLLAAFRTHLGSDWPSDNAFIAGVERLIGEPRSTEYLLAATDEDSAPCGVAQLRYRFGLWWAAEDCLVEDVFVTAEDRGKSVGRTLMELAVARAKERGCRRIELDVNDENAPALALYRSLGFDNHDARYGGGNLLMRLGFTPPGDEPAA